MGHDHRSAGIEGQGQNMAIETQSGGNSSCFVYASHIVLYDLVCQCAGRSGLVQVAVA